MTRYPIPGLTKVQKAIFEQIATGNYELSGLRAAPKSIAKLLEMGVIVRSEDKIVCQDRFGTVKVPSYYVPLPIHFAWCEWCSENITDEELPDG